MKKRILAAFLAATLSLSLLAGCTKTEEKEKQPADDSTAKSEKFISDDEFTLKVVCSGQKDDGIDIAKEMYKEMYPNATVETIESTWGDGGQDMKEKELLLINSGETPDVMKMVWSKEFAKEGLLMDMTEEVKDFPIYANLTDGQLDRMTYDGKVYGMTYGNNSIYMFYNKDILKQAGWDNPPTTIDEVTKLGKDILDKGLKTEDGKDIYLTEFDGGNWDTDYWLWANGGEQMNEDFTECLIDTPESIKAYQYMQDLVKQGSVPKMDGTANQLWLNNQIGLYFSGDWDVPTTNEAGLNYGVATAPVGPTGENPVSIGGVEWGVAEESKLKEEAIDFIGIFVSDEFAKEMGRGVTDVTQYDDPEIQAIFEKDGLLEAKKIQKEQLSNTKYNFLESPFIYPEGRTEYANALQKILVNLEDVKTVMTETAENIEKGIAADK